MIETIVPLHFLIEILSIHEGTKYCYSKIKSLGGISSLEESIHDKFLDFGNLYQIP